MPRTRLVLTAGIAVAAAALALPASAGEPRTGTLSCKQQGTYQVTGQLYGAAWGLSGSTQNFVVTYLEVDRTGSVLVKRSPGKDRLATHSCSYTLAGSGDTATVEGFLTPAG